MKTNDRLKLMETNFRVKIASEDWFAAHDREVMSGIDGALHLIGKPTLSQTELAKLRDRLKAAGVSHNLPKLDPRLGLVKAGNPDCTEEEIKSIPSEAAFAEMLGAIKNSLWTKKDALFVENRIAIRRERSFAKVRKALHNLLRDHGAGARKALEAMAEGKPAPSWILRSVAVAAK